MDFTKMKENLHRNGFEQVSVFETGAEAADYLEQQINGKSVAFGGSITVQQMGLFDRLAKNNQVVWHWRNAEGVTPDESRAQAMNTDVYISSVNGAAETGELINIDGAGNRVASILYGHKKVYLVIGRNKVAADYEGALWHARNVSAPKNAQRLKCKTPCAVKGDKCYNCQGPGRICRALVVLWKNMMVGDIEIVLVNEDLGY